MRLIRAPHGGPASDSFGVCALSHYRVKGLRSVCKVCMYISMCIYIYICVCVCARVCVCVERERERERYIYIYEGLA